MHFWGRNFKRGSGHTQMVGKGAVKLQGTTVTAAAPLRHSLLWVLPRGQLSASTANTGSPMPIGEHGQNTARPSWAMFTLSPTDLHILTPLWTNTVPASSYPQRCAWSPGLPQCPPADGLLGGAVSPQLVPHCLAPHSHSDFDPQQ